MRKSERHNLIMELLEKRKYCTVDFLSKSLFVAPITIRRDLTELEKAGKLSRCYGAHPFWTIRTGRFPLN